MKKATKTRSKRKRKKPASSLGIRQTSLDHSLVISGVRGGYTALGYRSAQIAIRDGRISTAGSGDYHLKYDRGRLVQEARRLERDNPIFQGMVDKAVSYIVGNGFGLQAKSKDPEWNRQAETIWKEFWKRPELTNLDAGFMVEQMVCREVLTVGDTGAIKTNRKKIQIIESEQIRGRSSLTEDGVIRNKAGTVTGFWVSPYSRTGVNFTEAQKYSTNDFLFVVRRRRPSSYRAAPPCQASFAMLHRINDVCDSEAVAFQLLARLALSVNKPNAAGLMQETSVDDDKGGAAGQLTDRVTEFDYGIVFSGKPGEEIKGIERNIPGKDFPASIETFLRLLGLPLGLPLEIILLNWTKSNYSQSRAVLQQAYISFIGWQNLLKLNFHSPIYKWVVDRAIADDRLPGNDGSHLHEWITPTFPWIDQLKEAQAYGLKLDRALCTHTDVLKSLNKDRDEFLQSRKLEIISAIKQSEEIKKETGVEVPWQHFAGLKSPDKKPLDVVTQPAAAPNANDGGSK